MKKIIVLLLVTIFLTSCTGEPTTATVQLPQMDIEFIKVVNHDSLTNSISIEYKMVPNKTTELNKRYRVNVLYNGFLVSSSIVVFVLKEQPISEFAIITGADAAEVISMIYSTPEGQKINEAYENAVSNYEPDNSDFASAINSGPISKEAIAAVENAQKERAKIQQRYIQVKQEYNNYLLEAGIPPEFTSNIQVDITDANLNQV